MYGPILGFLLFFRNLENKRRVGMNVCKVKSIILVLVAVAWASVCAVVEVDFSTPALEREVTAFTGKEIDNLSSDAERTAKMAEAEERAVAYAKEIERLNTEESVLSETGRANVELLKRAFAQNTFLVTQGELLADPANVENRRDRDIAALRVNRLGVGSEVTNKIQKEYEASVTASLRTAADSPSSGKIVIPGGTDTQALQEYSRQVQQTVGTVLEQEPGSAVNLETTSLSEERRAFDEKQRIFSEVASNLIDAYQGAVTQWKGLVMDTAQEYKILLSDVMTTLVDRMTQVVSRAMRSAVGGIISVKNRLQNITDTVPSLFSGRGPLVQEQHLLTKAATVLEFATAQSEAMRQQEQQMEEVKNICSQEMARLTSRTDQGEKQALAQLKKAVESAKENAEGLIQDLDGTIRELGRYQDAIGYSQRRLQSLQQRISAPGKTVRQTLDDSYKGVFKDESYVKNGIGQLFTPDAIIQLKERKLLPELPIRPDQLLSIADYQTLPDEDFDTIVQDHVLALKKELFGDKEKPGLSDAETGLWDMIEQARTELLTFKSEETANRNTPEQHALYLKKQESRYADPEQFTDLYVSVEKNRSLPDAAVAARWNRLAKKMNKNLDTMRSVWQLQNVEQIASVYNNDVAWETYQAYRDTGSDRLATLSINDQSFIDALPKVKAQLSDSYDKVELLKQELQDRKIRLNGTIDAMVLSVDATVVP
jgi:hypothetical protein